MLHGCFKTDKIVGGKIPRESLEREKEGASSSFRFNKIIATTYVYKKKS